MNKFNYASGAGTATVSVPEGGRVLQFAAKGAGSLQVGAGATVDIDPVFEEYPKGYLVGAIDIQFTDVDYYYVSWVVD